jgi:hypothetical protein
MTELLLMVVGGLAGIGAGAAIILLATWVKHSLKYPKINTNEMIKDWNAHEPEFKRLLRDPGSTAADVRAFEDAFERKWFK